jgi:two-component system OmpR family sensor kinase
MGQSPIGDPGRREVQRDDQASTSAAEAEEFMAVAAHDLRNPVAVVRASAQMAQRQMARGDMDSARGRLIAIVEQTDRLTEMIEMFLDAARISSERLPLHSEPSVDLREVVDTAVARARVLAPGQEARDFTVDIPERCVGAWDRARLVRAVRALLSNALLYGVASEPVRIEAERNLDHVSLRISGGGPGPNSDESAHLFERFYRGPSSAEAGQAGSGLGLFVARGIARRHGGEVRRVEGDTFEMELPLG